MRKTLLMSAALLGLAASPAFAQNTTPSTMSPSSPNANVGTQRPTDSLPTDPGMTGMRQMRGQMHHGAGPHHSMARGRGAGDDAGATGSDTSPGREYRGGAGSPRSNRASNISPGDTRSEIAPRLPDPAATSSTPESYLAAAQRSLEAGRTGAAQEALERAETRLLSRSTDQAMAASPADMPMVQQIAAARRALANRDTAAAKAAISAAMGSKS